MSLFDRNAIYSWCLFVAYWFASVGANQAVAQGKGDDDLLKELFGPTKEVIATLKTQARVGSAETGVEAIWQLGQHENGIPALLEILPEVRADVVPNILTSLGWQGPKAKSAFDRVAVYVNDPSFHTQTVAVWALGKMGDKAAIPKLEPFLKADHELLRFLAEEAIARCRGKELLPETPAFRPLHGVTLLHVTDVDEKASEFLFREALHDLDVHWKAITVKPFNPSWSGIGGMPAGEEERFSDLISFKDGQPQVAAVLISNLYPGEVSFRMRWELWNYVRRGGNLVMSSILFQPISGRSKFNFNYFWKTTIFDTLLPKSIGLHDAPFLDGVTAPERERFFGEASYGRGRVLVHDKDVGQSQRAFKPGRVPMSALFKLTHQEWRHLTRSRNIGNNSAENPLLWRQLFLQMVEGVSAFVAGVDVAAMPAFKAGASTTLPLTLKNYTSPATEFKLDVSLVSDDGTELATAHTTVKAPPKKPAKVTLPLSVPFALSGENGQLQINVSESSGQVIRTEKILVPLVPAFRIAFEAPATFRSSAQDLSIKAWVTESEPLRSDDIKVVTSIADVNLRPLLRQELPWSGGKMREANSPSPGIEKHALGFDFHFNPSDLPYGGYWITTEVVVDGQRAAFRKRFIGSPKTWRGRDELGFLLWGTALNIPTIGWERLRAANLHGGGIPEIGYPTWALGGTEFPFTPYGQWRADILAGPGGDAIRKAAVKVALNPYFSALDVVEESDLEIGTAVMGIGDVEQKGLEQYRIHLKQKYQTITALNAAWKSDYIDWSEIRLLGGVKQGRSDFTYTSRIGGTSGELVPVPPRLDPAKGIVSFAPYEDQNAWRWSYMWQLIEVWHQAFHQADTDHGLMPGGHMGLSAPFDYPHTRIYAGNAMSVLGLRSTLGRPTYGRKPHIILIGLPDGDAANRRLVWQGLASGARIFTIYAPGDGYGVKMMSADFALTAAGESLAKAVATILPKQEVFLATENAVSDEVLFLGGARLSPEYYEAFLRSGVLIDCDRSPRDRKLIVSGGDKITESTAIAMKTHAEQGGTLVLLSDTPTDLLKNLGLDAADDAPSNKGIEHVQFLGEGMLKTLKDASFASGGWRTLDKPDPAWKPLAVFAKDKRPAVLQRTLGKGNILFLNFRYQYNATLDLLKEASSINEENEALRLARQKLQADWYTLGTPARKEAESFRQMLATIMDHAGVSRACETVDRDGSVIPYVEAQLLETHDRSQKYLAVWADHHLPAGTAKATGEIALKLDGIKAVYDVYRGSEVPLQNGRFTFSLEAGEGTVYSLLTEPATGFEVVPESQEASAGAPLRIALRPQCAEGQPANTTHSFNVQVRSENGKLIPGMSTHLSGWSQAITTLLPSWNDPEGKWTIEAEDLTTGRRATTHVTMKKGKQNSPTKEPATAFRQASAEIVLRCQPLELPSFANFVPLKATLRSTLSQPSKVRVTLDIPANIQRLNGELSREIILKPQESAEISWELFIGREDALAMYYSAKPSGFRVGLRSAVHQLQDAAYPAVRIELLDHAPVRFEEAADADWKTGVSFRSIVPIKMMPLESRPPQIGNVSKETAELSISNQLDREVAGTLELANVDSSLRPITDIHVRVAPGANQTVRVALESAGTAMSPAIVDLPATMTVGSQKLSAGFFTVETVMQRTWLVRSGTRDTGDKNVAQWFDPHGALTDTSGWSTSMVSRADVPLDDQLQQAAATTAAAPLAYAFTRVWSPERRDVALNLNLVGADARVWIGGKLVYQSSGEEPKNKLSAAAIDKELSQKLEKGWNPLLVEIQQIKPRYLDPPMKILSKSGQSLRDLVFDPNGEKTP